MSPEEKSMRAAQELLEAVDVVVAEMEASMSPEEIAALHANVQDSAIRELKAAALRCGTSISFSDEPRFEDRSVYIDAGATPEAIKCVMVAIPFAKISPDNTTRE